MKIFRSFFGLYCIIITLFILSSWLVDEVWRSYIQKDIDSYSGYKTMLHIVGNYLESHPQERWEGIIENINNQYGTLLGLMPLRDLENADKSDKKSLIRGNTYVYFGAEEAMLHHLLPNSNTLITLGPAKLPTRPRMASLIKVLVLCVFGVVLYIWLKPMSRDLDKLRNSTRKFGQGDFGTKADEADSAMVQPMIDAFNMMADRIKRLIDAHKELSNAVAHELRTPLARSKFALQLLKNTDDEDKRNKYCEQISHDIEELEELVNESLLYASFDSERPELIFAPVKVEDLIVKQLKANINFEGKVLFDNQAPEMLAECDAHFITRALNNYISNAIKYGEDEIRVSLSIQDNYCIIRVEDNGEGVSDDFKSVIFDAFSRGDKSRNKETGGFGLGLAIVCRIMEWHKGEASLESSQLGGAAFVLKWPIKQ